MDWMLFWTAFGAIGGTLGALATAAAVFVALWQTKYSQKKKLKLVFSDDVKIATGLGENVGELVSLDVTNIGNRMTVLTRWGFQLNDNKKMLIVSNLPMDSLPVLLQKEFIRKFPYKLDIEQRVTLYYEKCKFIKAVSDSCRNNELDPNQKIVFYVTDSTGKEYCAKSQKKVKDFM